MPKPCLQGKIRSPLTNRCITIGGTTYKKLEQQGLVPVVEKSPRKQKLCQSGKVRNPNTGRCISITGRVYKQLQKQPSKLVYPKKSSTPVKSKPISARRLTEERRRSPKLISPKRSPVPAKSKPMSARKPTAQREHFTIRIRGQNETVYKPTEEEERDWLAQELSICRVRTNGRRCTHAGIFTGPDYWPYCYEHAKNLKSESIETPAQQAERRFQEERDLYYYRQREKREAESKQRQQKEKRRRKEEKLFAAYRKHS